MKGITSTELRIIHEDIDKWRETAKKKYETLGEGYKQYIQDKLEDLKKSNDIDEVKRIVGNICRILIIKNPLYLCIRDTLEGWYGIRGVVDSTLMKLVDPTRAHNEKILREMLTIAIRDSKFSRKKLHQVLDYVIDNKYKRRKTR